MKATMSAVPMSLEMGSSRRWLEALTTWFRESGRNEALHVAPLFDASTTDALSRASQRRAQWLRGQR